MKSPLHYFLLRCEKRFLCKCIFSSRGGLGRDNKKIRLVNCKCGCCIIFQKIWGLAPFFALIYIMLLGQAYTFSFFQLRRYYKFFLRFLLLCVLRGFFD